MNQKGYIVLASTFVVMIIMLSMALTIGFLAFISQKKSTDAVKSTQVYYAAEAGIEDALLRLKLNPALSSLEYDFDIGDIGVDVDISDNVGISKTMESLASRGGIARNIQTISVIDNTLNASFYYGIEVGEGGLIMGSGSRVIGNVFSGGNISGSGTIENNAVVSGNGHSISGVHVQGDAMVYSCLSGAVVDGKLTYVDGGEYSCAYGSLEVRSEEISQQPLPIPEEEIQKQKNIALEACDSAKVSDLSKNNKSASLGPCRINGNLNFGNGVTLTLTGTVYITGNVTFGNNDVITMSSSYAELGAIFMADGTISVKNNADFYGSGEEGSYILVISNSTSDLAISVENNTTGAVFYTLNGGLSISNGVSLVEATGYKVIMNNNSEIEYSSGIVNIYFASGSGAAWKVANWQEK